MIEVQTHRFAFPNRIHIKMFSSQASFVKKAKKHFVDGREPWERLFGPKILKQIGQNPEAADVSLLLGLYDRVVDALEEGMRFAETSPLYLTVHEYVEFDSKGHYRRNTIHVLAERGFRVVVHGGAVRSAYFVCVNANQSNYSLFNEGWRSIRTRGMKSKYREHDSAATVFMSSQRWFSKENWGKCPNPHHRPSKVHPVEIPDRHRQWLDELEDEFVT